MPELSRWDQITDLLAGASLLAPEDRVAYLAEKTGDALLQAEVLSLLRVEMGGYDLLEKPAFEWYRPEILASGPNSHTQRLLEGEIVANRFEIEFFLGRGGMGEVYAASDRELHERVALKLLHPELAGQSSFLDRFRREIRLARRISHPNVARVFDLVTEPDHPLGHLHFYVLELLEGETLEARLKRAGPIALDEALRIARQMAAGLSAVHGAGVLHRDFKPSNVILTDGRAVVTDFGLAAPIARETGEAALHTTSLLMGTPGYVAPEQWAGKPATVATDVYSFGIVLHEMITGRHPNAEGPKLEGTWGDVVAKCLRLEPAHRWKGPLEAVAELEPGWISRRTAAGVLAGAGSLAVAGFAISKFTNPVTPKPGSKLLVGEVQNASGDNRFDAIATSLRMHLEQSTLINLISPRDLNRTFAEMLVRDTANLKAEQYREAAWRMNAEAVVFGSFAIVGASPSLTVQVERRGKSPNEPANRETKSFSARGWEDVSQTVREAGNWVRTVVGDKSAASPIYDRMPEQVTTSSWEALLYVKRAEDRDYQQRPQEALLELESALRADPGFSFAAMRKADILNSMGRDLDSMRAWEDAMRLLRARPLSRREELRTLGMYAYDTHSFKQSEDQFARLSYEYPNDFRGYFYRSNQMLLDGRAAELLPLLNKAAELDSDFYSIYVSLGLVGVVLGDNALFERAVFNLARLGKPMFEALCQSTRGWFSGNFDAVIAQCRKLQALDSPRFRREGFIQEANVYAEAGHFEKAAVIYESCSQGLNEVATADGRVRALAAAGYSQLAMGKRADIRKIAERIVGIQASVTGTVHAAVLSARAGLLDMAEEFLRELRTFPVVTKTLTGVALAQWEIERSSGNVPAMLALRGELLGLLPRYGSHAQLMQDSAQISDWDKKLAMAPLFSWLHPHWRTTGDWGKLLRGIDTLQLRTLGSRQQLTTYLNGLTSI